MKLSIGKFCMSFGQSEKTYTLGDIGAWLRGNDVSASSGATLVSAYQQSVWVYACVNALGTNVAQVPFRFSSGERKGEETIESGELWELFNRPHPLLDRFQFWELLVAWLMLRGRAFVVALDKKGEVIPINRGPSGRALKPAMLVILNSDRLQKVVANNELQGWRYMAGFYDPLASQNFLPEEVIALRLPNPFDFFEGMSPSGLAMLAAQTDYASSMFMKGLMQNNADTGVIVTTEQQPTEDQRTAILAALKERKRAAGTADRPLFLWGGSKIEKPTLNNVDLQFLENRKFNRQEICAVFKVPQEVLGFTEDANYAVMDGARMNFTENTILPLCERLECALAPVVSIFGPNLFGWFDGDALPIMQRARRERFTGAQLGFAMGVSLEQLNGVFDLGLSPKLPHWKKSYLPFSLQEIGSDGSPVPEPTPTPTETEDPAEKLLRGLERLALPAPHICAGSAEYASSIAGSIKLKAGKLSKFFFEQRNTALEKLERVSREEAKSAKGETRALPDDIFDIAQENAKLMQRMRPMLITDLQFGGAQLWKEFDLGSFSLPPTKAIEFLQKRENVIKEVNQTTFDALKGSLTNGLEAGETYEQLVDRVKAVFQDATDRRAETIATTETNTAVNSGRFIGMQEAKVEKKSWLTSNLENTRQTHLGAEAASAGGIPLNEPFSNGLMYPGDPSAPAGETINCRCHVIAVAGEKSGRRSSADPTTKLLRFEEFTPTPEVKP